LKATDSVEAIGEFLAEDLVIGGGSGNMLPKQMNEVLQSRLAEVGVNLDRQPVEWAALS
jgi:ABC-type transport system substrate-binding protein